MVDEFRLPFVNFRARVTLEEPPIRPGYHVQLQVPMRTSAIRGLEILETSNLSPRPLMRRRPEVLFVNRCGHSLPSS